MLQVGERLGRYEVEKRCAVEKEDYDLAKEKKQQMARYRAQVYEQLELHGLLQGEPEVRAGHVGEREGLIGAVLSSLKAQPGPSCSEQSVGLCCAGIF